MMLEKGETSLLDPGGRQSYGTVTDLEKQSDHSPRERASQGSSFSLDWMRHLDDHTPVSGLTLPGTHDSAAYTYSWPFITTQELSIQRQLDAGIRYFDLRLGLRNNILEMVHGPTFLGLKFDAVLEVVYTWLAAHPTEGIIVQLKRDRKDDRSTIHFSQAVTRTILANPSRWRTANTTPTLGQLRGRIQLFRRFETHTPCAYGINLTSWLDNPENPFTIHAAHDVQLTVQDHYKLANPAPLPTLLMRKATDVAELLRSAAYDADKWHWYINFTSSFEFNFWYQVTPREVAVGGWWAFKWQPGINIRLRDYFHEYVGKRRYGIIAMDFPEIGTEDLIDTIILTNFDKVDDGRVWLAWIWSIFTFRRRNALHIGSSRGWPPSRTCLKITSSGRSTCRATLAFTIGFAILVCLVYVLHDSVHFCPRTHYFSGGLHVREC